jgi:tRNA(Leu) C34 or U34 (ribose-2'-O)-methylase TrmL
VKDRLTLIGLDIEGEWNVPLLANAAEMSRASLLFASNATSVDEVTAGNASVPRIEGLLGQFDHVFACEATERSKSVYDFAAPRGHLGIVVGNERHGISSSVLKKAEDVVSIPMLGRGLTSVNVAVAAAIILYAVERDLGRKRPRPSNLCHDDVDVLVVGPSDPSELGSLFRSAWAFGWQRVFLADRGLVWFTRDRPTVLAGRAAARCELNRVGVCPDTQLSIQDYDRIVICEDAPSGTPLSRYALPKCGKMLLVYGGNDPQVERSNAIERIYVDHAAAVEARFRHAGSILLSVISRLLRRGRRG